MTDFTFHSTDSAPAGSKDILANVESAWKFIPNLHRALAESPVALEAYGAIFSLFDKSSFSPAERQVIYLAVNYENECEYCMAGHSVLASMSGVPAATIEALRENTPVADARTEALRRFTQVIVRNRANLADDEVDAFLAAGFTRAQVLEVILGVTVKTMSNYTNHIVKTPNDAFMANTTWVAPSRRNAVAAE